MEFLSLLYHYSVFGLRLASELPLPELTAVGQNELPPEVIVSLGRVADSLPKSGDDVVVFRGGRFQANTDSFLLKVDGVARYLVCGGQEIVVEVAPGASETNVRLYLLGSSLAALCHQRGLLPIHANVICARDKVFAFAGESGAGKSTLAAGFYACGYRVLGDDLCVVTFPQDGAPLAWPGIPRLKLWRDAMEELGHDPDSHSLAIAGAEKYHLRLEDEGALSSAPLGAIYILDRAQADASFQITQLTGAEAVSQLMVHTYRNNLIAPLGMMEPHFQRCLRLARTVPVYVMTRRWGFEHFDEEWQAIEDHMLRLLDQQPISRGA